MDPFIGQIIMFAGNFAPRGWALCDGQLLQISSNTALFSILGTTYGGDGETTFGLPDLRGRVAVHPGNGPGLNAVNLGQKGGNNNVNLTTNQLPSHSHTVAPPANSGSANRDTPKDHYPAVHEDTAEAYHSAFSPNTTTAPYATAPTGNSHPVDLMQPFQGINFIIALQGTFPPTS